MDKKQKNFRVKYKTYETHVNLYHTNYPAASALRLPTLEESRTLGLEDSFWDLGHLTHPNEAWAVDVHTQTGINAFRTVRSCEEEMRRLAREVRQLIRSALVMQEKLESLRILSERGEFDKLIYLSIIHQLINFDQFERVG